MEQMGLGLCSGPTSGWDWKRLDSCSRELSDSIGFSGFSNRILSDFNGSVAAQSEIAIPVLGDMVVLYNALYFLYSIFKTKTYQERSAEPK